MKKYLITIGLFLGISLPIHFIYNLIHPSAEHHALRDYSDSNSSASVDENTMISENNIGRKKKKAADHKHEYNDYFFSTRSYPDERFDIEAYRSALISINDDIHSPQFKQQQTWDEEWRQEGPGNLGGRINALAVHPQTEDIIYAGAAWGGVWKTEDGGDNWAPIFDEQPFLSIATIEIDPIDPDRIYVGTGDVNISGYPAVGNGLYRSDDAGQTWTHLGLEETGIISKVKIDPNDTDVLYVGAMGFPFERDDNRGMYKSTDGGLSWTQSLFISDQTGVIDMLMHPTDGDILYAAAWTRIRNNTESTTYSDESRIWKTIDGGDNWNVLAAGLPDTPLSRIGLTMSAQNPDKLYTVIVDSTHFIKGVYMTEDAGMNWDEVNSLDLEYNSVLGGFGWYFGKIALNPNDDDEIYVLGVDLWRTNDGSYWENAAPEWWYYDVHADKHALVFGPNGTIFLGTDGGIYKSSDLGESWEDIEDIPVSQIYRVEASPHAGDQGYYGIGLQDNGSTAGNYADPNNWPRLRGGDGFQMRFHPTDDQIVWSETQNGGLGVSTDGGNTWFGFTYGIDGDDRRAWDMPYIISPHNPDVLYTGTFRMYKTENGSSPNWQAISEALTDSVIVANRNHTITTVEESPVVAGKLYTGSIDAHVWTTDDDGDNWTDISAGLPERYVTSIKASPTDADAVYVTHSGYKDGDNISHVHYSADNGQNWSDISGDLPEIAVNDIFIVKELNDQVLFLATDAGVYASENAGANWERIGTNMPIFQIYDLDVDYNNQRLAAATFARSLWTYDISDILSNTQDTEDPVILVEGGDTLYIDAGAELILPIVTASDDTDGDLTDSIAVDISAVDIYTVGTYPVIYTVSDAAGNSASYTIYVVVAPIDGVNISEWADMNIKIYPNPTTEYINLSTEEAATDEWQISITDIQAKLILKQPYSAHIDVRSLSTGTYILMLEDSDKAIYSSTFIKR